MSLLDLFKNGNVSSSSVREWLKDNYSIEEFAAVVRKDVSRRILRYVRRYLRRIGDTINTKDFAEYLLKKGVSEMVTLDIIIATVSDDPIEYAMRMWSIGAC